MGAYVGLNRRARRLDATALNYSREAGRLENLWVKSGPTPPGELDAMMERVHWHDAVAAAYRLGASRPWQLVDPDPSTVTCGCGYHAVLKAGPTK